MKTLIVYYSRTGTTKKLAIKLAKDLSADIEEIIDKKPREGMIGFMTSGRDALKKSLTEIKRPVIDPTKYDLVIIGTPNWAGKITPAVRTYLQNRSFKNVAFFQTKGSSSPFPGLYKDLILLTKKPLAILEMSTKEVQKGELEKIKDFVIKIRQWKKKL